LLITVLLVTPLGRTYSAPPELIAALATPVETVIPDDPQITTPVEIVLPPDEIVAPLAVAPGSTIM
jgi:hypothetical protein